MATKLSKLRSKLQKLTDRGKWAKALKVIGQVEAMQPGNPHWPKKRGEMLQKLGHREDAIDAFEEAARGFTEKGFLLKGVGLCKVILSLDPSHVDTQEMLADLYAKRGTTAADGYPAMTGEYDRPIAPSGPLVERDLGSVFEGGEQRQGGTDAAFIEIALETGTQMPALVVDSDDGVDLEAMLDDLALSPLFAALDRTSMRAVIDDMPMHEYAPGDAIVRQGEVGTSLYVLVDGECAVFQDGPPRVEMNRMKEGAFFGEIALMTSQERTATVEATTDCLVLELSRDLINRLVGQQSSVMQVMLNFFRERLINSLISTSPLFAPFAGSERRRLAGQFSFIQAEQGFALQTQGQMTPAFYIVLCGDVQVWRDEGDGDAKQLATLASGDVSGLLSLVSGRPSHVTVLTQSRTWLLRLDEGSFKSLILQHPEVRAHVENLAEERIAMLMGGAHDAEHTVSLS